MVMGNPLKRFREFIQAPSHSRTIGAVVILIIAAAVFLAVLVIPQQAAASNYGNASQVCGSKACGTSSCDNTGITYTPYISAGNCTYHSWNCSGNSCNRYDNHYWSSSCDLTDTQRNAGTALNGRCQPWSPKNLKCTSDSTGYTLTWDAIPQTTFRVYNSGNLLASPTTNSYRSTSGIKNYTVKSYGGGRENPTGTTISCIPPTPTPTPACSGSTPDLCGGRQCTNILTDISNCGVCGKVCALRQVCSNGVCTVPSCTPPDVNCDGTCVDIKTSNTNCGSCLKTCEPGQVCSNGVCTAQITPTPTPTAPACTGLTADPNNLFVGNNSNLSLTGCTGSTTYNWTSTCGTPESPTTSTPTTTWTAPNSGPTICTVWVNACSADGLCSPAYTTPITVNIPDCNTGLQPQAACVATRANTCSANNGTQFSKYTTYNNNATVLCNPVNVSPPCTISNCNVGNVCTNGTCVTQATPTPTPTASPSPSAIPTSTPTNAPICEQSTIPPQTGPAPLLVTLHGGGNAGGSGGVGGYKWDFENDGVWDTGVDINYVSHIYQTPGIYKPKYIIIGDNGVWSTICDYKYDVVVQSAPVPGHTYLTLRIGMDGIGAAGDNVNPDASSSNKNPVTTNRNVDVQISDTNNQTVTKIGSINYDSTSELFLGNIDLGVSFTSGSYSVKVKSDGHLRKLYPGLMVITSGQTLNVDFSLKLVTGDIDLNNALNINDYNILLSCVTSPFIANIDNHALCNSDSNYTILSDLEDNGVINEFDYNLFLREYAVQNGD